jgi:hypothetical protein
VPQPLLDCEERAEGSAPHPSAEDEGPAPIEDDGAPQSPPKESPSSSLEVAAGFEGAGMLSSSSKPPLQLLATIAGFLGAKADGLGVEPVPLEAEAGAEGVAAD